MWNAQMNGLLNGTTCCIFDGNPGGHGGRSGNKNAPDWTTLWRFAAELGVTYFGAGAAFFANCMKAGVDLPIATCQPVICQKSARLAQRARRVAETQSWGTEQFEKLGTRISGGQHLRRHRLRRCFYRRQPRAAPQAGEMQCRLLGCAVEAWNEQGEPVINEVGELVCTQPMPSMPLHFGGDAGNKRYLSSYFDMYPNVWRHGDWLKIALDGGCIIYGRSDATINRHGLRMGTSELYSAVEALPEVMDSMVVDLEYLGRESYMPLFVVLREGVVLDDALRTTLKRHQNRAVPALRAQRHLPGGRDSAHPVGQKAGAADQEAAAGPADGESGQQGRDGEPGVPGLVRGVCGG